MDILYDATDCSISIGNACTVKCSVVWCGDIVGEVKCSVVWCGDIAGAVKCSLVCQIPGLRHNRIKNPNSKIKHIPMPCLF